MLLNRAHAIICAGVFTYTFVDFGARFEVNDPDGEEPKTSTLANITQVCVYASGSVSNMPCACFCACIRCVHTNARVIVGDCLRDCVHQNY